MERVLGHLPKFGTLCTLRLESLDMRQPHENLALDVTALQKLEHLTIANFHVNSIAAPRSCTLHACWDVGRDARPQELLEAWLCSTMWSSATIPLASLLLHDSGTTTTPAGMQALEEILSGKRRLDYLSLQLCDLIDLMDKDGAESFERLQVSKHHWQGILRARNLRLYADDDVLVSFSGIPSWKRLSLETFKQVDLYAHSMSSLLAGLRDFNVFGVPLAPLAVQLGAEMARAWRQCHVRRRPPGEGPYCPPGVYHVTSVSEDDMERFDEVMSCGCQCCLLCLRRDGTLPMHFRLPKIGCPFGTLLKTGTDGSARSSLASFSSSADDDIM